MKKQPKFSDPNPDIKFKRTTSNPTEAEAILVDKFDPLSPNRVENVAGVVIRAAVDIARYRRSAESNPEHYERLERTAQHFASVRVAHSCVEQPGFLEQITAVLGEVNWDTAIDVPRPQVSITIPYAGTEAGPVTVAFINQPTVNRAALPA